MVANSLKRIVIVTLACCAILAAAVQPAAESQQLKPSALVEVEGVGGGCAASGHSAVTPTQKFTNAINDGIINGFASKEADTVGNCSPSVSTTALLPSVAAKAVANPSAGYFRRSLDSAFVREERCYLMREHTLHKTIAGAFIELFASVDKPKESANFIVAATRVLYSKSGSTPVASVSLPNFPPLCFTDKFDLPDQKAYGDRLNCKSVADWIQLPLDPIPAGFEAYTSKLGQTFASPLSAAKFKPVDIAMMVYLFQDAKACLEKDECEFSKAVKAAGIQDICDVNHINFNFHRFIDSPCDQCTLNQNLPSMFDPYVTYLKAKCSENVQTPVTASVHSSSNKLLSPFGQIGCELDKDDYNTLETGATAHLIPGINYPVDPQKGVIVPNVFETSPSKFNELFYWLQSKTPTKKVQLSNLCEDVRAARGPAEGAMDAAKSCPRPCPVLYTPPVVVNATAAANGTATQAPAKTF